MKIKEKIEKLCKEYNVETDLIDTESLIDKSLTDEENFNAIKEVVLTLSTSKGIENTIEPKKKEKGIKQEKEEVSKAEKEQFVLEQAEAQQKLDNEIKEISKNKNADLEKYFGNLKNYVKAVAKSKGYLNSLFVVSSGGYGKTTQVLSTLKEEKVDYVYLSNYTTCVEFINFLYEHKDKTIVLDDVEGIFSLGSKFINLLKGGLWGIGKNNKRIISYLTTDKRLKAPHQFEFTGKMFFLLNKKPNENDELVKALLSRSLVYEINFSYSEILQILAEFVKIPYKNLTLEKRQEIFNFLQESIDESVKDLNFRTLIKLYDLYIADKENWKELSKNLFKRDERLYLLKKFLQESNTIKEAQQKFTDETGYSRRQFYRIKTKCQNDMTQKDEENENR